MATETLPTYGAYSLENWVTKYGVFLAESLPAAADYPVTNVLDPLRSRTWRSTAGITWNFDIDLGSAMLPTVFGFIDNNIDTVGPSVGLIAFTGSDNSSFTDSPPGSNQVYAVNVETLPTRHGVLRWYWTLDDTATAAAARQYWRVALYSNSQSGAYHELGGVWLGTYTAFKPEFGYDVRGEDPSGRARSRGGAPQVARQPIARSFALIERGLALDDAYSRKSELDGHGSKHMLVDMHAHSTVDAIKVAGAYYCRQVRKPSLRIDGPHSSTLSMQLEEARRG